MNTHDERFDADRLYPMTIERNHSFRCLGGPFEDIDDVLDGCWDEMME